MATRPGDARVFEAATHFFAALLGAGRVNDTNLPGIARYCVRAAVQLVKEADGTQAEQKPLAPANDDLDLEMELEEIAKGEGSYRSGTAPAAPARGR